MGRAASRLGQRLVAAALAVGAVVASAFAGVRPRARGPRPRVVRAIRLLLPLAVAGMALLVLTTSAESDVGLPVNIDTFGNSALTAGPFTRTVIPLPLPMTSTTPVGTFSQGGDVGTMEMTGLGNGFSGVTLQYTPTAGGLVDLTSDGEQRPDPHRLCADRRGSRCGRRQRSRPGYVHQRYRRQRPHRDSAPRCDRQLLRVQRGVPVLGFRGYDRLDEDHEDRRHLPVPDHEHRRRHPWGAGQPDMGDPRGRHATECAEPDRHGVAHGDRSGGHRRRLHRVVHQRRRAGTGHLPSAVRHRRARAGSHRVGLRVRRRDTGRQGQRRPIHLHGRRVRDDRLRWGHG